MGSVLDRTNVTKYADFCITLALHLADGDTVVGLRDSRREALLLVGSLGLSFEITFLSRFQRPILLHWRPHFFALVLAPAATMENCCNIHAGVSRMTHSI